MMILLTGGASNGKSTFGESLCLQADGPRYYLAAMQPYGPEGEARIARHRKLREGKGFTTIERYTDYASLVLPARGTALLECIANLTANEMFDETGEMTDPVETVLAGVDALRAQCDRLIVITNDVGSDGCGYPPETEAYVKALGRINAALAARADTVCELVAGIPILLKGALPQ
ncbi:MAG: bifunctional adenosylcobinamide kinase/adenosylcobinamide-phosphate guanylyltransferase [Clostridia bacterium]|nr:bifunctional adenosylcobinamide kinase/adenosylcobinamide-phosphate guanylyltransferase [Clostridia bacterium]